jgi:hypothetical protein
VAELPQPPRFDPNAEYIKGIPYPLPPGETVLWQGAPEFLPLMSHVFRARIFVIYFVGLLIAQALYIGSRRGSDAAVAVLLPLSIAGGAVLLYLLLFSWLTERNSWYAITSRRVVLRIGVALTVTINVPLRRIASAGVRVFPDGSGEVAFPLFETERLSLFQLWPHWRPWGFNHPVPQLRGLPKPQEAADALRKALEAWVVQESTETVSTPRRTPEPQSAVTRDEDGLTQGEMAVSG